MFKINCEVVSTVGEKFKTNADEIKKIYSSLTALEKEIQECWGGGDSYNFHVSFNGHNKDLTHIVAFLKNHGELLEKCAETHNELDVDFGNAMSS